MLRDYSHFYTHESSLADLVNYMGYRFLNLGQDKHPTHCTVSSRAPEFFKLFTNI